MRCLTHGKEWMDHEGNCIACEEIRREEWEWERFEEERRAEEERAMKEHFRQHPHG
jgi:hypothetical protein